MTHSLVTASVYVNAVVQQFEHDSVGCLRLWLVGAYLKGRVPLLVALTTVSVVAATSALWRGDGSGDDGEWKLVESRSGEISQDTTKTSCPSGSGKSRTTRRKLLLDFCTLFVIF